MSQQLFVLVASEQAVASLPPVLELAEAGDQVVWLESPQAQENRWSEGASQVLKSHQLRILPSVSIEKINDPFGIAQACKPIVKHCRDAGIRPVIVANGGTKLTPFGPYSAFYELEPVIAYGADRPAELWVFPRAFREAPQVRPYRKHNLDLEDILTVSRHRAIHGQRIWAGGQAMAIKTSVMDAGHWFEVDVARRVIEVLKRGQGYGVVHSVWMNVIITKSLGEQESMPLSTTKKKKRKGNGNGGQHLTDWDILLVLKNGLLIHLECKSGAKSTRDLLGRTAILRRAASHLAQMYTCIPFDMAQPNQYERYIQIRSNFDRVGLKLLPVPRNQLTAGSGIPSFESELERILLAYRPGQSSH